MGWGGQGGFVSFMLQSLQCILPVLSTSGRFSRSVFLCLCCAVATRALAKANAAATWALKLQHDKDYELQWLLLSEAEVEAMLALLDLPEAVDGNALKSWDLQAVHAIIDWRHYDEAIGIYQEAVDSYFDIKKYDEPTLFILHPDRRLLSSLGM